MEPDGGRILLHPTGPNDRFGWTEPEGKVFQIAADNLARLQEEIYRVCYLGQAGGELSGEQQLQSGLSKQSGFRDHARSTAGLRRRGQGNHEAGAAGGRRALGRTG